MSFPETHEQHVIKRAFQHHRVVLEPSDIRKLSSKIRNGKYFVLSRSKKCGSSCAAKCQGCTPVCLMVTHKDVGNESTPLPIIYCEVKREMITVLRRGCVEFKRYQSRLSSR